jgi:hypothetical protein
MNHTCSTLLSSFHQILVRSTIRILDIGLLIIIVSEDVRIELYTLITSCTFFGLQPGSHVVSGLGGLWPFPVVVAGSSAASSPNARSASPSPLPPASFIRPLSNITYDFCTDLTFDIYFFHFFSLDTGKARSMIQKSRLSSQESTMVLATKHPIEALLPVNSPDVREFAFPITGIHFQEVAKQNHIVVPGITRAPCGSVF